MTDTDYILEILKEAKKETFNDFNDLNGDEQSSNIGIALIVCNTLFSYFENATKKVEEKHPRPHKK